MIHELLLALSGYPGSIFTWNKRSGLQVRRPGEAGTLQHSGCRGGAGPRGRRMTVPASREKSEPSRHSSAFGGEAGPAVPDSWLGHRYELLQLSFTACKLTVKPNP